MAAKPGSWLSECPPRRWHLLAAGGCLAAVYLFGVSGTWWPTPDSALYLGLGRSLATGDGYVFNGKTNNVVTPALPLILAGLRIVLGPSYWGPNLFVALCGLGAIGMIYLSIARLSDRRIALAVALMTAISYNFYLNSHLVITDAPFALLFWSVLYACLRYQSGGAAWLVLAAVLTAGGIAVRAPGLTVLGPLALGLLLDRRGRAPLGRRLLSGGVLLAVMAAAAAAFYLLARWLVQEMPIYLRGSLGRAEADIWHRLHQLGLGLLSLPWSLAEMLTSQQGAMPVGLIALILGIVGMVHLWRTRRRLIPTAIVTCVVGLAFFVAAETLRGRYLLPIQAMFLFVALQGLCRCVEWTYQRLGKVISPGVLLWAATIFSGVVIGINLPRFARTSLYYGYMAHTGRLYQVARHGWFAELEDVAATIRRHAPPGSRTMAKANKARIFHWLSGQLIVPAPENQRETPADAAAIHKHFTDHPDVPLVVIDTQTGTKAFLKRLKTLFDRTEGLELLYDRGGHYRVYGRAGAIVRASPREPPVPTRGGGAGRSAGG